MAVVVVVEAAAGFSMAVQFGDGCGGRGVQLHPRRRAGQRASERRVRVPAEVVMFITPPAVCTFVAE